MQRRERSCLSSLRSAQVRQDAISSLARAIPVNRIARLSGHLNRLAPCVQRSPFKFDAVNPDIIGWAASAILLATLARQIHTQSQDKNARGVSRWLFIGQMAASIGFIAYSAMVGNWVFIVTNFLILLTAIVGQVVVFRKRQ